MATREGERQLSSLASLELEPGPGLALPNGPQLASLKLGLDRRARAYLPSAGTGETFNVGSLLVLYLRLS